MGEAVKSALVIVTFAVLIVGAVVTGRTLGSAAARDVVVPTPVSGPVDPHLPVDEPPVVTPGPPAPPTPSVTWSWDPKNPNQCVDPREQGVPPEVPRCKVPPDPGPPKPICPSGTTLVYPNNQPACLPTSPH